jgi:hypothetical protein
MHCDTLKCWNPAKAAFSTLVAAQCPDYRKSGEGEAGMNKLFKIDKDYSTWLKELKSKIRSVQIKAAVKVNTEVLNFYWNLGADIVEKQAATKWGDGFLSKLSQDLMAEFPDIKGFSERNIKYIRQWFLFYRPQQGIGQQPVAQLEQGIGQQLVS